MTGPAWFAPGELARTAAQAAASPRRSPAHRRPLGDQLPLELGQRGEDVENQPTPTGTRPDLAEAALTYDTVPLQVLPRCGGLRPLRDPATANADEEG